MSDILCPLCGKPNSPDQDECQYCHAPLKPGGFLPPSEGEAESNLNAPGSEEDNTLVAPGDTSKAASSLEDAIPDWLKDTEAGFLEPAEPKPGEETKPEETTPDELSAQIDSLIHPPASPRDAKENAIDEEWLASLLAEASAVESPPSEPPQEAIEPEEAEALPQENKPENEPGNEQDRAQPASPAEKPDWLTSLEASSKIKIEGGIFAAEPEQMQAPPPAPKEEEEAALPEPPEWLTKAGSETPQDIPVEPAAEPPQIPETSQSTETPPGTQSPLDPDALIVPAELPGWLEALRPADTVTPTGPVEDVSKADMVTAGPLSGLRGVIAPQPSAIRAQKPPTYSIKLRVTEDQQERLKMMEDLLADEEKPKPLPTKHIITTRNIFRLAIAAVLLLPIIWMIVSQSHRTSAPQPGNIPGVVDFTQHLQSLAANAPVLIAFDYEAGFSGELNIAVTNVVTQLMKKNAYLTLMATSSAGPALAESVIQSASSNLAGNASPYANYANLGYLPGGTMGLLGLAASPKNSLPYALDGKNVWAGSPLNTVSSVKDFAAVIVITNDPDTARFWIEQVGRQLQDAGTPLLVITSSQAEPLIRPYYEASPAQVQGLIAGLAGGVAYARTVGNYTQDGTWDALSAGVTVSILIIIVGSIAGVVAKMLPARKNEI